MKSIITLIVSFFVATALSGCWAAAVGAGAEAGYVLTQKDRSASEVLNDQRITSAIKTKLLADSKVSGTQINVDTFKSAVTLKGAVDTNDELNRALRIAQSVSGVQSVENKLVIVR